ncbi:MAG: CHAT domain-containing protein [Saprospiraceae bacterium]
MNMIGHEHKPVPPVSDRNGWPPSGLSGSGLRVDSATPARRWVGAGTAGARYHSNERENMMGIKERSSYEQERARITHGLLTLLDDVGESPVPPISPVVPPVSASKNTHPDDGIMKILFLAANPSDTARLQLTTEHSRIATKLQEALEPERFPLKFYQAVTPSQFQEYLFLEKPDIVHFSGHGDRSRPDVAKVFEESRGMGREADDMPAKAQEPEESGIYLLDEEQRHAHFVNSSFLSRIFKTMVERQGIPIKVVVFNACHSSAQAEAVSRHVPYVVGTSWSVGDRAAIAFASGFYFGIARGMDIEDAVDFGINQALAFNEPEDRFILYKDGVKVSY